MDDLEKTTSLLQADPETWEHKLQLDQERVDREATSAVSARRAFACRVVTMGFFVLFVVLFIFKAVTESADQRRTFSSSCMHALGGGAVGPRGSLLHFDPRCTEELKEYFDQAYYSEVRRVSDEAMVYFRQQVARHQQQEAAGVRAVGSGRGTVIFDIDETALSNMDGFFGSNSWARFLGSGATDRCVRPHLEYSNLEPLRLKVMGESGEVTSLQATQRRPLCNSPPLRATLDLYNFLYDNNYTVVFLTGRSEDGRPETEANLADAGYGRKCVPATATTSVAAAAYAYAAAADPFSGLGRRQLQDPAAATTAATAAATAPSDAGATAQDPKASPFAGLFSPPAGSPERCYSELVMRLVGDERLASVFKAEARTALLGAGHVLVGNIGDQFSDLVGQAAAAANFKLPNPVYTLL